VREPPGRTSRPRVTTTAPPGVVRASGLRGLGNVVLAEGVGRRARAPGDFEYRPPATIHIGIVRALLGPRVPRGERIHLAPRVSLRRGALLRRTPLGTRRGAPPPWRNSTLRGPGCSPRFRRRRLEASTGRRCAGRPFMRNPSWGRGSGLGLRRRRQRCRELTPLGPRQLSEPAFMAERPTPETHFLDPRLQTTRQPFGREFVIIGPEIFP
jgi:hypothetical protein